MFKHTVLGFRAGSPARRGAAGAGGPGRGRRGGRARGRPARAPAGEGLGGEALRGELPDRAALGLLAPLPQALPEVEEALAWGHHEPPVPGGELPLELAQEALALREAVLEAPLEPLPGAAVV